MKAQRVLRNVFLRMGVDADNIADNIVIAPYHDPAFGGFNVTFDVLSDTEAWNDRVVDVIHIGQRVALGWSLYGDIRLPGADACTKEVLIPGCTWMQWQLLE